jgi:hypothetical protein
VRRRGSILEHGIELVGKRRKSEEETRTKVGMSFVARSNESGQADVSDRCLVDLLYEAVAQFLRKNHN